MKIMHTLSALALFATAAIAQDAPPAGSQFFKQKTVTYVDDSINNVTDLAGKLTCMLNKGGFNMAELVNSTWKSIQPESECFHANWNGYATVIFESQRLSNNSPREVVGWLTLDTPNNMPAPDGTKLGEYVMTLTQTEGGDIAPPFGVFEMKFYLTDVRNPEAIPAQPWDTAFVKSELTDDGVRLTTLRNRRYQGDYQSAVAFYQNGSSDILVRSDTGSQIIGAANNRFFRSSNPDGTSPTCKARDAVYNRAWNNKLYDANGEPIELENGNISVEITKNGQGQTVSYNAGISTNNYWFETEQLSTPSDSDIEAVDAATGERIDLVWAPGELLRYTDKDYTITVGETFQFTNDKHKASYDGTGFAFVDQSLAANSYQDDLVVHPTTGTKYVKIHEENGHGTWHPTLDAGLRFFRQNSSESWSVNPQADLEFTLPINIRDSLLTSTSVTPMVCVSDWRCPHIVDYTTTGFGDANISVYKDNSGKINVSDNSTDYNKLFKPITQTNNGNDARNFNDHHYLVTPLDVSGTNFPTGTLPASVYYDFNKNGVLEATERPIMTLLRQKKNDDWVYNGVDVQSDVGSSIDEFGFYFDLVTKEQWQNGCDNKKYDQQGNIIGYDGSFFQCENKVKYQMSTNNWSGRYFPRKANGEFIYQEIPLAVTYTADKANDMNEGFNDNVETLTSNAAKRVKKLYQPQAGSHVNNKITGEKCTDSVNGCEANLGPEDLHQHKKLFTHDGREFYPLPGDEFTLPEASASRWFPAMNLESGTKVYDFFDSTKYYFVKNIGVSQHLIEVSDAICAAGGLTYNDETDQAFANLQSADLPNHVIDSELTDMPTWSERSAALSRADALGCYVDNGNIIGTCN